MHFVGHFVIDIIRYATELGADENQLLAATGSSKDVLLTPDHYVDYGMMDRVIAAVEAGCRDVHFGLHLGENVSLMATQFVDRMIDTSPDLESAFENAVVYSRMISDSMTCRLETAEDSFRVIYEINPDWALHSAPAIRHNLDCAMVCALKSLQRLTQANYYPLETNFFYPRPRQINEYYRVLNCSLNFDAPVSSIVFQKRHLQTPVAGNNEGLLEQFRLHAHRIFEKLPREEKTVAEVKKAILENISPQSIDIESIAEKLHRTPRTLQRQLKSEGASFREIQSEIRMRLAKKLLSAGQNSVGEIAYLLGFSEPSAFVRSFKKQSGSTPKQFLKSQAV